MMNEKKLEINKINENKNNIKIEEISNFFHKKIKILTEQLSSKSNFREYEILKSIKNKSDYLINLIDAKIIRNGNYTQYEFIFNNEGVDLKSLINSTIFNYKEEPNLVKWILFQILKGVEKLHSLNIIHRNINPENILISSTGGIKIIGFGKAIYDNDLDIIRDKISGKISYNSPECLIGKNFNNKTDIWSVGVLMLELYCKKDNIFEYNKGDIKNNKIFNQLKYLSNFFNIPFNFEETNFQNKKNDLIKWLNSISFNKSFFLF